MLLYWCTTKSLIFSASELPLRAQILYLDRWISLFGRTNTMYGKSLLVRDSIHLACYLHLHCYSCMTFSCIHHHLCFHHHTLCTNNSLLPEKAIRWHEYIHLMRFSNVRICDVWALSILQVWYIPQAKQLTHGGFFFETDEGVWDTPESARMLLKHLKQGNTDRISTLKTANGKSVIQLIDQAVQQTDAKKTVDLFLEIREAVCNADDVLVRSYVPQQIVRPRVFCKVWEL